MKYYKFSYSTELEDNGEFPQIQKMSKKYNYDAPNSIYELSRLYNNFPDFEPNLEYLILAPKSRITNILSVAMLTLYGFFVDTKVEKVFKDFNLPKHRYYNSKVKRKTKIYDNYKWLHIVSDYTDFICYESSKFYTYNFFDDVFLSKINPASKEILISLKEKMKKDHFFTIKAKKIALSPNFFELKLDLFKISEFDHDFYISERLKKALIESKITGYSISEAIIEKASSD